MLSGVVIACSRFTVSKLGYRDRVPFGVPVDMALAIGQVGDARAWYSLGCVGHGVAPTHLNGQTLADLLLERQADLTSIWFVQRRTIPWPP